MPATTSNQRLKDWVDHWAGVFQPDDVHWCDGSDEEWERLTQLLVDAGTFELAAWWDPRAPAWDATRFETALKKASTSS